MELLTTIPESRTMPMDAGIMRRQKLLWQTGPDPVQGCTDIHHCRIYAFSVGKLNANGRHLVLAHRPYFPALIQGGQLGIHIPGHLGLDVLGRGSRPDQEYGHRRIVGLWKQALRQALKADQSQGHAQEDHGQDQMGMIKGFVYQAHDYAFSLVSILPVFPGTI
jgi:hypothetical protein